MVESSGTVHGHPKERCLPQHPATKQYVKKAPPARWIRLKICNRLRSGGVQMRADPEKGGRL